MHPRRATAAAAGERAARGTVVRSGVYTTPAGWGRRVILDLTGRSICCHHIAYMEAPEHTLEFLLSFDGRLHWYAEGYFVKFEIKRAAPSKERPHGLRYSLTLHGPGGKRLVGFDNAHGVAAVGSRHGRRQPAADHWHRTETDPGRPYRFRDAATLIDVFSARWSGFLPSTAFR